MVNRPSTPEIITVNSEALQAQIRDLLPSQNGFGSELQASNVITPIIDLTSTAEGSSLPSYLQSAIAFGSLTSFDIANTTTTIASSPGFYRIIGVATVLSPSSSTNVADFIMNDGSSTKIVWSIEAGVGASTDYLSEQFDITFFLRAGDSFEGKTDSTKSFIRGSVRQVALGDGTLVQPNGFPL